MGPVELRVIAFQGNQFRGEIIPAIAELVEQEIVRLVDILLVYKAQDGRVSIIEIKDLDDEEQQKFEPIISDVTRMVSQSDVDEVSANMQNNSSAAILLFEELWANRFKQAVEAANGQLVLSGTVEPEVIEELLIVQSED